MRNPVETAIRVLSPGWALRREQARLALSGFDSARANYDAAKIDREWVTVGADGTAEQVNSGDRHTLMLRARALERNSDMVRSLVGAFTRNIVGTGIRPQARVRTKSGKLNSDVNKRLEKLWNQWIKSENCDVTRTQGFYEMQKTLLQRQIVDGEAFVLFETDNESKVPLRLQCLEADALDCSLTAYNGATVVGGIEVSDKYRPLAYHFTKAKPDGWTELRTVRVLSKNAIHLFFKDRFTQLRGVTLLAPIMRRIRETGEYLDAEILKAKIAACLSIVIKSPEAPSTPNFKPGVPQITDIKGNQVDFIQRGAIQRLSPGSELEVIAGNNTSGNAKEFAELETRLAGAGAGLSYEVVSRDMSRSTYSSARQGHLEDRRTFQGYQDYLVDHLCRPVWQEFVKACYLANLVNMPGYATDPEAYFECEWVSPGWQWIDPAKDVAATKEQLKAGLTTLSQVCNERGMDWEAVLEQRKEEKDKATALGLTLDIDVSEIGGGGSAGDSPADENG